MSHTAQNKPMIALALTTALAGVALSGCSTKTAPIAGNSFQKAQTELARGNSSKAVKHAEAAVQATPRDAGYRAMLGAAYMEAGRFGSAATSFNDAMVLGNTDARTVLSYALAETAQGNYAVALATLKQHRNSIDDADLGLAYALAGEPARGVHVLSNTLRSGENTAKVRQNLAYSYALQGNWRAARLMAAEDVPANQINQRIAEWAANVSPEAYQIRVANLLGVKPSQDSGQPLRLALSNNPSQQQMFAESAASAPAGSAASAFEQAPSYTANGELAPVGQSASSTAAPIAAPVPVAVVKPKMAQSAPTPVAAPVAAPVSAAPKMAAAKPKKSAGVPEDLLSQMVRPAPAAAIPAPAPAASSQERQPVRFAAAFGSPVSKSSVSGTVKPAAKPAVSPATTAARHVSRAVVQHIPAGYREPKAAPKPAARVAPTAQQRRMVSKPAAANVSSKGTHLVQLGSFTSRAVAESASKKLSQRHSLLKGRDIMITEAKVNGKTYWRVAAAGFGQSSAKSACSALKSKGQACFAYAASRKLPGAVNRGIRIAAR
ncbi:MAG: SPOR domain-containing protein [Marinomonas sp.]